VSGPNYPLRLGNRYWLGQVGGFVVTRLDESGCVLTRYRRGLRPVSRILNLEELAQALELELLRPMRPPFVSLDALESTTKEDSHAKGK